MPISSQLIFRDTVKDKSIVGENYKHLVSEPQANDTPNRLQKLEVLVPAVKIGL